MKPHDWQNLDLGDQRAYAKELFGSQRGMLIMGQALAQAVKAMRQVEPPRQEVSNIEDMEVLGVLFEPWFSLYMSGKAFV